MIQTDAQALTPTQTETDAGARAHISACLNQIKASDRFAVLNCVLGIQRLDSTGACTLFLLLRRLSAEETMSTRLTHDLCCIWTDEFPRRLL